MKIVKKVIDNTIIVLDITGEVKLGESAERLSEELNLTDEQKPKVQAVFEQIDVVYVSGAIRALQRPSTLAEQVKKAFLGVASQPVPNPNYGAVLLRQPPMTLRLGVQLRW